MLGTPAYKGLEGKSRTDDQMERRLNEGLVQNAVQGKEAYAGRGFRSRSTNHERGAARSRSKGTKLEKTHIGERAELGQLRSDTNVVRFEIMAAVATTCLGHRIQIHVVVS